jgi:hypothetical protein
MVSQSTPGISYLDLTPVTLDINMIIDRLVDLADVFITNSLKFVLPYNRILEGYSIEREIVTVSSTS